jgi:hypothetical protein
MTLRNVITELDSIFGIGWSKKNEALVIEYYKATQIGRIGGDIIDAANSIGIALNEGVTKELVEIGKKLESLAGAIEISQE